MDDTDLQLGRVVCVSGSHVVMVWEQHANAERAVDPDRLQKGALVKLKTPATVVFALVTSLTIPNPTRSVDPDEAWLAELELIGESDCEGSSFRHGVSLFPTLGDAVWSADEHDLSLIYGQPSSSAIKLGTLHSERAGDMYVEPDLLLGRHFAILGTTGCGKSCALTLILRTLLDKHEDAHIVLLDPHNEYQTAFGEHAELLGPERLRLPYWILNSDEIDMVMFGTGNAIPDRSIISEILHELIAEAKNLYQGDRLNGQPVTVNTPTPYRLSDVIRLIDDVMGRVDKPSSLVPYKWLKNRLNSLSADPRFSFMFGGITVSDNFADILSQILRIPGNGRPISIVDLSSVPSEVINAVVSVILRLTFDFSLWSRGAQPILLVCEEAHRYAPLDDSLGFEATKNALARIAKEGRKYGLSLCLVSQRPSELAPSVLSQCNTSFVFRITSLKDQEIIQGTVADSASGLLDFLPLLGNGEAVVIGDAVSMPVRIRFDRLDQDHRPQSMTARFSEAWRATPVDKVFVREVVDRWRMHQR
ncbi:MAG: ATP-binding protein [Pseudomonadota bacterium]